MVLGEFFVSKDYPEVARQMIPTVDEVFKVGLLVIFCLQPVRDRWGYLISTSGVRRPNLNKLVGGSATSQHLLAEADDFTCPGVAMEDVYHWIIKTLNWQGQVRYYPKMRIIHVGMPSPFAKKRHVVRT